MRYDDSSSRLRARILVSTAAIESLDGRSRRELDAIAVGRIVPKLFASSAWVRGAEVIDNQPLGARQPHLVASAEVAKGDARGNIPFIGDREPVDTNRAEPANDSASRVHSYGSFEAASDQDDALRTSLHLESGALVSTITDVVVRKKQPDSLDSKPGSRVVVGWGISAPAVLKG